MVVKSLLLVILMSLSSFCLANITTSVVYDKDDRIDVNNKSRFYKYSRSVASLISNDNLDRSEFKTYISGKSLQNKKNLCADEKFQNQMSTAKCVGSLIGDNYLLTANHCVRSQFSCDNNSWVFDYDLNSLKKENPLYKNSLTYSLPSKNIYKCEKVVYRKRDKDNGIDIAIVKLTKTVDSSRNRFNIRTYGKINDEAKLVVIGNPSGIPTKIDNGARVISNNEYSFFKTNSDTFKGSSGSPVINIKTGIIEGIIVQGEQDYISRNEISDLFPESDKGIDSFDLVKDPKVCKIVNQCLYGECRGETATRITAVAEDIKEFIKTKDTCYLNNFKNKAFSNFNLSKEYDNC